MHGCIGYHWSQRQPLDTSVARRKQSCVLLLSKAFSPERGAGFREIHKDVNPVSTTRPSEAMG